MPLFLDRLPLREVRVGQREAEPTWHPLLPLLLTEPDAETPPDEASCLPWKLDTGNALVATCWRFHLERAGLSPGNRLRPERVRVRMANDTREALPQRRATLWLMSNIPALRESPYPIFLDPGLPFYDRAPRHPARVLPLVGIRALRRARLRVQLDFSASPPTLSVWTPEGGSFALWLRRLPRRFHLDDLPLRPDAWVA